MTDIASTLPHPPIPLVRAGDAHSTRETRTGALTRVTRGIYVATRTWALLAPWDRYRVRVQAAGMKHPDAVFHLESAVAVHGLPLFGDPRTVHVLGDGSARSRESGGVVTHTTTGDRIYQSIDGFAVCSLADTVVDIARARHPAVGLAVADAALRQDAALSVEQLVAMNESRASSRGRRRARWALHRASALAESPLESIDRAVIEWLGYPEPELQAWIGRDRVDKWWAAEGIAGESDGDLKYSAPGDEGSEALRNRHRRDARLFDNGVRAVPHWGWAEVVGVDALDAILRSAGLRPVQPRDAAPLFSLARAVGARPR